MDIGIIKRYEGNKQVPYYDVNHYRAGWGSDTTTRADGSVVPVQKGMYVSPEDAERDLARRSSGYVREWQGRLGDVWSKYNPTQQGVLGSLVHNYGSTSKLGNIVAAAQSGDREAVAKAIEARASDNGGVNYKRRMEEAAMFRSGALTPEAAKFSSLGGTPTGYTGPAGGAAQGQTQTAQTQQEQPQQEQQTAQNQSVFAPQVEQIDLPLTGGDQEMLQNLSKFKPSTPETNADTTKNIVQNAFKFSVNTPEGPKTALASNAQDYTALSQIANSGYSPEQQDGMRNMYATLAPAAQRQSGQSIFGGPQMPDELEKIVDGLLSA